MNAMMNNQLLEVILHNACRECGLDSHTKTIRYKKEAYTYAEKIAVMHNGVPLVVKNSYMFCNALDICFFFTKEGNPCFSYSGIAYDGNSDITDRNIQHAFRKASEVLSVMKTIYMKELSERHHEAL